MADTEIARYNINKAPGAPTNTIYVGPRKYHRLREIGRLFQDGQIDQWEMAARCRRIEPQLKMFRDNNIVVMGDHG